jgi:hypothetical protein
MEPFTAAVTAVQATVYISALGSSLLHLYKSMRHGHQIFHDYRSSVNQLHFVITQLGQRHNTVNTLMISGLKSLLDSIERTTQTLLRLFSASGRMKIGFVLVARKSTVSETFASLERQKITLLLYLATDTSMATGSVAALATQPAAYDNTIMPIESDYGDMVSDPEPNLFPHL